MNAQLFNLFFNTATSFWAGFAIIALSVWLLKIPNSRWKLFFFLLPFIKVIYDLARGLPSNSILNNSINPLELPAKHGLLSITFGYSSLGPRTNLSFWSLGHDGTQHATSLPDYLYFSMQRIHPYFPLFILTIFALISSYLLIRRFIKYYQFEQQRRLERSQNETLDHSQYRSLRKQKNIDVYISQHHKGSAFTGGIVRPYICFPRNFFEKINHSEREAVLLHELAHIKRHDLFINLFLQILGDMFWFIPGYRYLQRKIEILREFLADQDALQEGAQAPQLASAILHLQEMKYKLDPLQHYSAFVKKKNISYERIQFLLDTQTQTKSRWLWRLRYLRPLIALWIVGATLTGSLAGNLDSHNQFTFYDPSELLKVFKNWVSD